MSTELSTRKQEQFDWTGALRGQKPGFDESNHVSTLKIW